jgi:hypothetical protein
MRAHMALIDTLRDKFEIGRHKLSLLDHSVREADGFAVETHAFTTAAGERVRGLLVRPSTTGGRRPAIIYTHAHGFRYDIGAIELLDGRPSLQGPMGPVFARAGYVTLCIDLPCFGERAGVTESAATKARLWEGRSLAGQMVGELASTVDYLASRPDVDPARIGAFGISMGATFTYWLAAVEPRIAAAIHLCAYADFRHLIATGAHDLHGFYLTVPGLLEIAGNGEIAGLIAPRPQFIGIGDEDPLTPPPAFEAAFAQTKATYRTAPDRLVLHREPQSGHVKTPAMHEALLAFVRTHL